MRTVSSFFKKRPSIENVWITLKENDKPVTSNKELAATFDKPFSYIVPNLSLHSNLGNNITNPNITDPVFYAIKNYENHPSIHVGNCRPERIFPIL